MAGFVNPVDLKRNTTNHWVIVALFVLTGIFSLVFWWRGRDKESSILQPYKISYKVESKKIKAPRDTSTATTKFITSLQEVLKGTTGEYSVYVYRLGEGKGYGINENAVMPAASIMKVPIMAAVLIQVDAGVLTLDSTTQLNPGDIRTGSGPIEFMAAGTNLSIDYLLKVSGQNSDNSAPVILTKLIGQDEVVKAINTLEMSNTSFADNTTTATDLSFMWKNLYSDSVLSATSHAVLWTVLQNSIYEDRLPVGIPDDIDVVHKVGSGENIWADSGIVLTDNPFVVTILDRDVNMDEAKILVPKLTKMIWEFEKSRTTQQKP
jgi:beta-lactamase class A